MRNMFVFGLGVTLLLSQPAYAVTHYVSPTGGHTSPYTNWVMAATNIQAAISACNTGDVVLVTNGTYSSGGVAVFGNMTNRIAITNAITVRSVNGPAYTRIVGQGPIGSTAIRCAWVASNAVLDGFTLTNGFTLAEGHSVNETCGGGVWCEYDGAIVSNCIITGCGAINMGGGFYYGRLVNCVVSNNTATFGGGGAGSSADADMIDRCVIVGNRSIRDGGGLYGGKSVRNSHFAGNRAGERGGGMRAVWNAESCTVAGNFAEEGGGVSGTTISNSIVYYNTDQFGSPNHAYSIVSYSCTTPDPGGIGNITNSPGLAGLWNPHIVTNSPCINRGTNSEWMAAAVDVDGEPRLAGSVDMGCDELYTSGMNTSIFVVVTADRTNAVVGVPIRFGVEISKRPRHFSWNFGDGSSASSETVVEHAYTQAGYYVVTNRAWNNFGYVDVARGVRIYDSFTNYVAKGGSDTPPYDTWAKAASNIQDAVSVCAKGGTVLVSNGTYAAGGAEMFSSNRVAITNAMTVRSVNGAAQTFILGVPSATADAMRSAYVCNGATLEGFTLANGRSRVEPMFNIGETRGGGLFAESGARIVDCVISNNGALNGGGSYGWGTFERCILADNSAASSGGGALYGYFRNCTIGPDNAADYGAGLSQAEADNCGIYSNRASEFGGGMAYGNARRCHFEGNYATTYSGSVGGAAYYASLDNCLVLWNYARSGGGGTFYGSVRNCTIRGNDVSSGPGGGTYGSSVDSSVIYFNYAVSDNNTYGGSCSYSCTTPDPGGTGNITDDPQFVNDFLGDYRLMGTSPCIDKGDPLSTNATDYAGVSRPLDGNADGTNTVDMGAYEFASGAVDADSDGLSDGDEVNNYGTDPLAVDTDEDTQGDGDEVIAGSNPTNSSSFFVAGEMERSLSGAGYVISWDSLTGRVYALRQTDWLPGTWSNVTGFGSVTGTGFRISYTNPAPPAVRFHSLNVRLVAP